MPDCKLGGKDDYDKQNSLEKYKCMIRTFRVVSKNIASVGSDSKGQLDIFSKWSMRREYVFLVVYAKPTK